ncbi:MAG TPA: hypothetical protein VLQ45_28790 [Thermoanaerobaculia bacterium]|nr:hypothetical protein [Thermoanaerobaculia bacterium]
MKNTRWMTWIALFLIALAGLPALAQEPLATVSVSGGAVDWLVNGSYERVVLTVSDPEGTVTRQEVKGGKGLTFSLYDAKGNKRFDGTYTWELRADPVLSASVKERLAASRKDGDASVELELRRSGQLPAASVLSGAFTVSGGSFVENDLPEDRDKAPAVRSKATSKPGSGLTPMFEADQVIPDDLIVQGSGCFGFDCVNNESFGFDTIRLKENNLRIKFEDTSAGTFPSNDWQLTANDSASGGANKFSIEDITGAKVPFTVTAGASTNSIFVDSTGRVGFRTSTPVLDLHVATSNTPGIRLEQNNSGGFTAQTWDIAGNEANFFVRDVTGGSRLPFRIRPGAPTSSIDISADGDVGVGTASPDEKLHVEENVNENSFILMENPNTGTEAAAVLRAKADTAIVNFQAHSSTRTLSRFGVAIGGYAEMLQTTGNGLLIGTTGNTPLIFGTSSTSRMQIAGTGAVTVSGNFTVTGVKNFAMPDPADSKKAIYYAALEGPEAGTYFRGTGKTVGGKAVIELPGYFSRITETQGMTVQLTPNGGWSQLYVEEKSPERLVVRVAEGNVDVDFDFFVQGIRLGYSDYQVERPNDLPNQ